MLVGQALLLAWPAFGQQRLFEVVPPDRVSFNYPTPPREGARDYFPIAENGQARCVVVLPAGASKRFRNAAAGLRAYLSLVTGAKIRLVPDTTTPPDGLAAIHVGDTAVGKKTKLELPDLRYGEHIFPNLGGYLVKTLDPRTLVIRGNNDPATTSGIVGFLERYVGVHQYWPGSCGGIGDVVPSKPTLFVPEVEWRDWPYFLSRHFSGYSFHGANGLDFLREHHELPCSENYSVWLPPEMYGEEHSEFFPFMNGKRHVPPKESLQTRWQPCVSNPQVVRIMAEGVVDYFREHPDSLGVNFSVNDGNGDCMCEKCRAVDPTDASFAHGIGSCDRYVRFTNEVCNIVEREYPSKTIVFLAYAATRRAPLTIRPHRMIMPVLTTPGNFFEAWDEWMRTGVRHMGIYTHHDDDFMFLLPKLDIHQSVRRIRYAVASGRARIFYGEMFPIWPISGIVTYVTSRLLWDPRQDVDALLDEYYAEFFGPAAEPMKASYETLEAGYERWLDQEGEPHWYGRDASSIRHGRSLAQFKVLAPEEADRAAAALVRASEAANSDQRVSERIHIIRAMFGLIELGSDYYWTAQGLQQAEAHSEADAKHLVEDARRLLDLRREMSDYIQDKLERPPLDKYRLFQRPTGLRNNPLYEDFKSGKTSPQDRFAISAGANAATEALRKSLGRERAAAWWRNVLETETDPLLAAAFETAVLKTRGVEIRNLASDPGFEELGKRVGPDELALDQDVSLNREQQLAAHFRVWFPERSPYRVVLSKKEAHSGNYSLMIEGCHRGRLSRYAKGKPKSRYSAGLWVKRNSARGSYVLVVVARRKDGAETELANVAVTASTEDWQEVSADVITPEDTKLVLTRFFIRGQAGDARCWVDDLFIGEYAE